MSETVVIAGALAQRPGYGGHTWVFLHYLLGFRRLGWQVVFLDRLEPPMCLDAAGTPCLPEQSVGLRSLIEVMRRFDLHEQVAVVCNRGERWIGMSRAEVLERVRDAHFLLNIMGYCTDEDVLAHARRRVFLDIDPGFGQMWCALGLHNLFDGHDVYLTVGANIGQPDCTIPTCGLDWHALPPPVVLDEWTAQPEDSGRGFTSVASWRGPYGPIPYRGTTYGLRVHEFRRFVRLPVLSGQPFYLALDIHPSDERDRALLVEHGWSLVDPHGAAGNPWSYRSYIQASRAECMIAKQMYVQSTSGWMSDRSVEYLASGRPVLAQDTGIGRLYPTGSGLLTFRTMDEALAGVEAIEANYHHHARTARDIAEEYFDSDTVLQQLIAYVEAA
jgi:hypothetical protein